MGTLYYIKIPFGLRNTREKYQRLTKKVFEPQIGRSIEVYMDEMVIKNKDDFHFL